MLSFTLKLTMKYAVVSQEVPAVLWLPFPVHHPGAHDERRTTSGGRENQSEWSFKGIWQIWHKNKANKNNNTIFHIFITSKGNGGQFFLPLFCVCVCVGVCLCTCLLLKSLMNQWTSYVFFLLFCFFSRATYFIFYFFLLWIKTVRFWFQYRPE